MISSENKSTQELLQHFKLYSDLSLDTIISQIESKSGKSIYDFISDFTEKKRYYEILKHCVTTNKVVSIIGNIPVEACTWYRWNLDKEGHVVASALKVKCPYTKNLAHLITADQDKFYELTQQPASNQLNLFL